ncbi:hypothetical protein ABT236_24680 [Streptomyces sp. NPDC001523]|uniref:hypothetical protein n=1 Tax=Streptomyces sp. NPDC001523 TaxID=3154383 RepID=UPI003316C7C6
MTESSSDTATGSSLTKSVPANSSWRSNEIDSVNSPVGIVGTLLSAFVFACLFTYALEHYRSWHGFAAFVLCVLLAILGALATVPYALTNNGGRTGRWQRIFMWGAGAVLAGLLLSAAVLGDATFSMSALIGMVAALAIPSFGEVLAVGAAAESAYY